MAKSNLAPCALNQGRYTEALGAYAEARQWFTDLDEPGSVAVIWHQTGRAYQMAGQPVAAEDANRKSLAIEVRLGNVAGQASTLFQLGNLYDSVLNRPEEAARFYRQAADKSLEGDDRVSEGRTRNNLAGTLHKLGLLDEARQEIHRAIECKGQRGHATMPWTSWAVLAAIETDTGNTAAAAKAKRKAIACFLAYRRDGGENHHPAGIISLAVTQALRSGESAEVATLLQQLAAAPEAAGLLPFIGALQAVVAGSRDPALADQPELDYTMAVEILLLIETMGGAQG